MYQPCSPSRQITETIRKKCAAVNIFVIGPKHSGKKAFCRYLQRYTGARYPHDEQDHKDEVQVTDESSAWLYGNRETEEFRNSISNLMALSIQQKSYLYHREEASLGNSTTSSNNNNNNSTMRIFRGSTITDVLCRAKTHWIHQSIQEIEYCKMVKLMESVHAPKENQTCPPQRSLFVRLNPGLDWYLDKIRNNHRNGGETAFRKAASILLEMRATYDDLLSSGERFSKEHHVITIDVISDPDTGGNSTTWRLASDVILMHLDRLFADKMWNETPRSDRSLKRTANCTYVLPRIKVATPPKNTTRVPPPSNDYSLSVMPRHSVHPVVFNSDTESLFVTIATTTRPIVPN